MYVCIVYSLYVSNKIVNLHCGCKMEVCSEGEGRGTTLSLYIPLLRPAVSSPSPVSHFSITDKIESSDESGDQSTNRGWGCFLGQMQSIDSSSYSRAPFVTGSLPTMPPSGEDEEEGFNMSVQYNVVDTSSDAHLSTVSNNLPTVPPHVTMYCDTDDDNLSPTGEPVCPAPQNDALNDLCIMVVDDSVVNRRMLIRVLKRHGLGGHIEEAEDGLNCLEKMGFASTTNITSNTTILTTSSGDSNGLNGGEDDCMKAILSQSKTNYHACILDNYMPNMNGTEAAEKLRELGYQGLIVGLTGDGGDESLNEFRKKGANFVLTKPLQIQLLVDIINTRYNQSKMLV
jgi:CheY-like chemotaxis protein